jgi:hypothetical protein
MQKESGWQGAHWGHKTVNTTTRFSFDGVEIHAGNGYLLQQFMAAAANQRNDEYGGNMENRCRILMEVLKACVVSCTTVQEACPKGEQYRTTTVQEACLKGELYRSTAVQGGLSPGRSHQQL